MFPTHPNAAFGRLTPVRRVPFAGNAVSMNPQAPLLDAEVPWSFTNKGATRISLALYSGTNPTETSPVRPS